jgi:hypothetical protein
MARRFTVTERALIGRVKRKLAHNGELLTVVRAGSKLEANLGRFIICDGRSGNPKSWGGLNDLVAWARELGVMHADEGLAP